jgi:hypothetical protein
MLLAHITSYPTKNINQTNTESTTPKSYINPRFRESYKQVSSCD